MKHLNTYLISACFIPLILFSTCIPKLEEPVRVNFEISMKPTNLAHFVVFDQMIVSIKRIGFHGIRREGNDVYFNTRPGDTFGTHALTNTNNISYVTHFDIQQGNYKNMEWEIETMEIPNSFLNNQITEYDDYYNYDERSSIGLILKGNFTRLDATRVSLFFLLNPTEILSGEINWLSETDPFPVLPENMYTVRFEIDPEKAFSGITRAMLEEADSENDDYDNEYIIISSLENENLYNLILFGLRRTITATIK